MARNKQDFRKANNFKGSMGRLLKYLSKYRIQIIMVVIFAALSTIFNIVGPRVLAKATDEIVRAVIAKVTGSGASMNFGYIGKIALILIAMYLVSTGFGYILTFIMAHISTNVSYDLRKDLMDKVHRLPLSYFNDSSYGNVLSSITNDVDTINTSLNQSITQGITSITQIIGVLVMMITISFRLTLVALAIIPVITFMIVVVIRKSQKYFKAQQNILGELNGKIEEDFTGHLVIKAFNKEENRMESFQETNQRLYETGWKAQFLSGLMMPIMNIISNLGYVFICVLGASFAAAGTMTIGGIQAFIQYVRNFTQPIAQLGNISNQLQLTAAAAERVFNLLEEDEDIVYHTDPSIDLENIKGDVEFEDVHFGYEDTGKIVINDFSTKVSAGQKVAIVGPTGAGKTTIVKLLMGFHELISGKIKIDGHDIKDFSKHDLREEFTMVLQDTWLFNGTIRENIRYGRLTATDEEVYEAAKAAQADYFIRTLPDGYDTIINEEASNISQGQKQLLTIARAMLANSSILILDEATSSVDTRTEVKIQEAMDRLMEGRTSFVIAHRLSTIRDADTILVMKDGDIIEQGNHDNLMEQNGFYANLYNSQFS